MIQTEIIAGLLAGIASALVSTLLTAGQMRSEAIEQCASKGRIIYHGVTITCAIEKDGGK